VTDESRRADGCVILVIATFMFWAGFILGAGFVTVL
jgi:hypothetical protein